MKILKLLVTSLLVFSLNVNLSAVSHQAAVKGIASSTHNIDAGVTSVPVANAKVYVFVEKLFSTPSLYIKWLGALEVSLKNGDFSPVNELLNDNECTSCLYTEAIQVIEEKKAEHLVFWFGDYETNLISENGTGKKLKLVVSKHIEVQHNRVLGAHFAIDDEIVLGATFKNRKLTWDYGSNMQPNNSKGSVTFAEVFLDGKYVGHQFRGLLTRWLNAKEVTETFVGFSTVVNHADDLSTGGAGGSGDNDSNDGTNAGDNIISSNTYVSKSDSNASVTIDVLDDTVSDSGGTAKFTIVLNSKPILGDSPVQGSTGKPGVFFTAWSDGSVRMKDPLDYKLPQNVHKGQFVKILPLEFYEDNWNVPQEIIVDQAPDYKGGNGRGVVVFSSVATGSDNYADIKIEPIHFTHKDADAGVTVKVLDNTTSTDGDTAVFTIVLNSKPKFTPGLSPALGSTGSTGSTGETVVIVAQVSDPNLGLFKEPAVGPVKTYVAQFTKQNWNVPQQISVYGQDKVMDGDGNQGYQVEFNAHVREGYKASNYAGLKIDPIDLINLDGYEDINPLTGKPEMRVDLITYPAKKFGAQLWTTENMHHIPSKVGTGFWSGVDQSGNKIRYYKWHTAMNAETLEGSQGICAKGWRVPTDKDWKTLEGFLGMNKGMQDEDNAYRGTDQGAQLMAGSTSGFNAELLGYHSYGSIKNQDLGTRFTSSTERNDGEFVSRYIGERHDPIRYILLKQSSESLQSWSFSEVEVMVDGKNVARNPGVVVEFSGAALYYMTNVILMQDDAKTVLTDGSTDTGLGYGRETLGIDFRYNKNGLEVEANGWLKIDLGAEYLVSHINLKEFADNASNGEWKITQTFAGNKIVAFAAQDDIDGKQTMKQLALNTSLAIRVGGIKDGSNSTQSIQMPFPYNSTFHNAPNAAKKIWRGVGGKTEGNLVRCVRGSYDKRISVNNPKKITLKVNEPMVPIAFSDTITSATKTWAISPAVDNGLTFDTTTGTLSGTPLTAKASTDYQITTVDDSTAVSTINITIVDTAILVDSIQITGKNIVQAGSSTQLNSFISPSYATNKKLAWFIVGDDSIAKISQTGELTTFKPGRVMVVAVATDNSATYGTFAVASNRVTGAYGSIPVPSGQSPVVLAPISFKGKDYLPTTSNRTGRTWLDRNLGASETICSTAGTGCYGDLYQWGRGADGHQLRSPNPVLTDTKATSIKPNDGKFIVYRDAWVDGRIPPHLLDWTASGVDDSGKKRHRVWMNGSANICPAGFGLPTLSELKNEVSGTPVPTGPLNISLPLGGVRDEIGQLRLVGVNGYYWTQDVVETVPSEQSKNLIIHADGTYVYVNSGRSIGMSVRCIKNLAPFISPSVNSLTATIGVNITPITFTNVGRAAIEWTIMPTLTAGLSFDRKTGKISGTPHKIMPAQRYRITAQNTFGVDTALVRIAVDAKPIFIRGVQIVTPSSTTMSVDTKMQLSTIISPSNANDGGISWSSSNPEIVSVDNAGVISAKNYGTATLFARVNDNPLVFDSITIAVAQYRFNKKSYNAVVSARTGRTWLDRNIGANRVCRTSTDIDCYGGLYQFGRATDGHQNRFIGYFSDTHASTITPNEAIFFRTGEDWTTDDSSGDVRKVAWSYGGSNNVCPTGFRVPTIQELEAERIGIDSAHFENFLKLPMSGKRNGKDGAVLRPGIAGHYWSSTPAVNHQAQSLNLISSGVNTANENRNQGFSVRCIQGLRAKNMNYSQAPMVTSGIEYKAVRIGAQIWTAENMRHGVNSDAGGIYSYDDSVERDAVNGKYYTWSAATKGTVGEVTQGICAQGWHIPTNEDWNALESYLGMDDASIKLYQAWRSNKGEGVELKKLGSSGFNAVMTGRLKKLPDSTGTAVSSILVGQEASFWTTDKRHTNPIIRSLNTSFSSIYKGFVDQNTHALNVRCIKNPPAPMIVRNVTVGNAVNQTISYKVVEIGNQTWTARNMRHNAPTDHASNDGQLYSWKAAMNGSEVIGAQGICMPGWHIPTDRDWQELEQYLHMTKAQQNARWAWRGTNQGLQLKVSYIGFDAKMSGKLVISHVSTPSTDRVLMKNKEGYFWTSSRDIDTPSDVLFRAVKDGSNRIYRGTANASNYGLSVRCIKDAE